MKNRLRLGRIMAAFVSVASLTSFAGDRVLSFTKDAQGMDFKTEQGQLSLDWYGDELVRVRFVPGGVFKQDKAVLDRTMLVDGAQQPVAWELKESPAGLVMKSSALSVVVNRETAAVSFVDAVGNELLSERAGENRSFKPFKCGEVDTLRGRLVFDMDDSDAIYGMGQHQDGFMNRRHVPTRLVQHNTRISMPVVVSPAGYGLFFNHMTQMDLNEGSSEPLTDLKITNVDAVVLESTEEDMALHKAAERFKTTDYKPAVTGSATFTPTVSGVHGFYIRHADPFKKKQRPLRIWLDGEKILHYINFWNESAMGGSVELEAGKTYKLEFDGAVKDSTFQVAVPDNRFDVAIESAEDLDYFFLGGNTIDAQIQGYRQLTGAAPIPPKYMFGLWQCRERYKTQDDLLTNAREFRARNIPVDIIVQDWQWWSADHSRVFNKEKYPEPKAMIDELKSLNLHSMFSVWAEVKNKGDEKRWGHEALNGDNLNVYDADNREMFWSEVRENLFDIGADSYWFDSTEGFPIHMRANTEYGPGYMHHNDFSLFVSMASYDGHRAAGNDTKRPLILTRSAWGGQQRYGSVMWSGDISSTWDHYRKQIAAGLNFCMAGVPYWTTDTAGFFRTPGFVPQVDGGAEKDQYTSEYFNELLTRWMQYSTFCPVQRTHGYRSKTEMWRYKPETFAAMLDMVKLRYRILPYSYSLGAMISKDGYTGMRGLAMDFGCDPKVADIYDQFMYGPAFMACPIIEEGARTRSIYLPEGTKWIEFWAGGSYEGGQTMDVDAPLNRLPVFVKAGSIVPCGPDVEYAEQKPWDALEIRIYPGADGSFTLYEDEGENHNYENGAFSEVTFSWNDAEKTLTISDCNGEFPGMLKQRKFNVVVVRPVVGAGIALESNVDQTVEYEGNELVIQL